MRHRGVLVRVAVLVVWASVAGGQEEALEEGIAPRVAAADTPSEPAFESTEPLEIPYENHSDIREKPVEDLPEWWQQPHLEIERASNQDEPAPAEEAAAAALPSDRNLLYSALKTVSALCIVLALIFLAVYLVRRFGSRTPLLAGPSLGMVLGRIYLTPKASLHFVKTGGRVLVVGVTQERVGPVAEFDAEAFEAVIESARIKHGSEQGAPDASFFSQLRAQSERMNRPAADTIEDSEIANLRGDIERLQKMFQDTTRE